MILDTAHIDEEDKQCALIQAARKGDFKMIHRLLEHGTDIECSLINCKPLLLSITPWAEVTARLPVISGADTNAQVSGQIHLSRHSIKDIVENLWNLSGFYLIMEPILI